MASINKYKVVVTERALADINGTYYFIVNKWGDEHNAATVYDYITDAVMSLAIFPKRIKLVDIEPARSSGVRRLVAGKYSIIYTVHNDQVLVWRVFSNMLDIDAALSDMAQIFGVSATSGNTADTTGTDTNQRNSH